MRRLQSSGLTLSLFAFCAGCGVFEPRALSLPDLTIPDEEKLPGLMPSRKLQELSQQQALGQSAAAEAEAALLARAEALRAKANSP